MVSVVEMLVFFHCAILYDIRNLMMTVTAVLDIVFEDNSWGKMPIVLCVPKSYCFREVKDLEADFRRKLCEKL
jgi:hypothetical protein